LGIFRTRKVIYADEDDQAGRTITHPVLVPVH
jgi:hypothetical protein